MRITLRGFAAATVGLVSAVGLAGCSGNSTKPTVLPSLSTTTAVTATTPAPSDPATRSSPAQNATTPTTTPTPSTSTPSVTSPSPSAPKASSALFAEATTFVRSYYATAAAALHDKAALARWKDLYLPSCSICSGDYSAVSGALAAGDRYEGGQYRLMTAKVRDVSADGALVDITFYVTAAKVFDAKGTIIAQAKRTKLSQGTVGATRTNGRWLVTYIHDNAA